MNAIVTTRMLFQLPKNAAVELDMIVAVGRAPHDAANPSDSDTLP
jgi:hypothetical protein